MKRRLVMLAGTIVACTASAQMPKLDDVMKGLGKLPKAPSGGSDPALQTRSPARRESR